MPEEAIPAIAYNHPHTNGNGFKINNIHLRGLTSQMGLQQTNISQTQAQSSPPNSMYCNQGQQRQVNTALPYMDNHPMLNT